MCELRAVFVFTQTLQKPRELRRHCVATVSPPWRNCVTTVLQIVRIPKMQTRQHVASKNTIKKGGPLNLVCGAGKFGNILSAHVQHEIQNTEWMTDMTSHNLTHNFTCKFIYIQRAIKEYWI